MGRLLPQTMISLYVSRRVDRSTADSGHVIVHQSDLTVAHGSCPGVTQPARLSIDGAKKLLTKTTTKFLFK